MFATPHELRTAAKPDNLNQDLGVPRLSSASSGRSHVGLISAMSGAGTAGGVSFQAEVAAYFGVEALAGDWQVRWELDSGSQIERVWCEGPERVDDVSLLLSTGETVLIQAKRRASVSNTPGSHLGKAIAQLVSEHLNERSAARLVLAVGTRGTDRVAGDVGAVLGRARDAGSLDRARLCRTEGEEDAYDKLLSLLRRLWETIGDAEPSDKQLLAVLERIWVTQLAVESDGADLGRALDRLGSLLAVPVNRQTAWSTLTCRFTEAQKRQSGGTRAVIAQWLDRVPATRLAAAQAAVALGAERQYLEALRRQLEGLRADVLAAEIGEDVPRLPLSDTFVPLFAELPGEYLRDRLLRGLNEPDRRLLELGRDWDGTPPHTLRDTGDVLGLAAAATGGRESTVLARLREELAALRPRPPAAIRDVLRGAAVTVPVLEVLGREPRVVITGDPGSGKSSLLQYVAWTLSDPADAGAPQDVPFPLALASFARTLAEDPGTTLSDALVARAGRFGNIIRAVLADGRGIVLLDGLDETVDASSRSAVATALDDFLADPAHDDLRVIVTSRVLGFRPTSLLLDVPVLRLGPVRQGPSRGVPARLVRRAPARGADARHRGGDRPSHRAPRHPGP